MVISQKNLEYLEVLALYKKVLIKKTRLLQDFKKNNTAIQDLPVWNQQLAEIGSRIIFERKRFINYLNHNIAEAYTSISGFHRPVEVWYQGIEGESLEEITDNFTKLLAETEAREKQLAICLAGPHRDDFNLKSEGLFLPPFSSRGELRSQVLALKILELEYLSQEADKPVLLLDDVFSELDETRKGFLLKYLQGKFQTFITTTQTMDIAAQHITLSPAEEVEEEKGVKY